MKPTILIIEDSKEVANLWTEKLEPVAEVRCAETMARGMVLMQLKPEPDIVLLDLNLPDSNPIQSLHSIPKLKQINPYTTVIVITGMLDDSLPKIAAAMGADSFQDKINLRTQESLYKALYDTVFAHKVPTDAPAYQRSLEILEAVNKFTTRSA